MTKENIKFSYHRDIVNPRRVLTIARRIDRYDDAEVVLVGFAMCSPKDQFSKKRGRQIACGRLDKDPIFDKLNPSEHPREAALRILKEFFGRTKGCQLGSQVLCFQGGDIIFP